MQTTPSRFWGPNVRLADVKYNSKRPETESEPRFSTMLTAEQKVRRQRRHENISVRLNLVTIVVKEATCSVDVLFSPVIDDGENMFCKRFMFDIPL